MPRNLWNDDDAPSDNGLSSLAYRSRLLASDRTVVNVFGGNTSTKTIERDHLDRKVDVLWVKGSGSDMSNITEGGFAALRLEEVLPLMQRSRLSDEDMVTYLSRTVFEPGRPRQSIETLLHAFVPAPHIDHTHPDAIISIACAPKGESIMREIYGERGAWVPYVRPGFTLSKMIGDAVAKDPRVECVVMANHGLVTWGQTSKECYRTTIRIIQEAEDYIAGHARDLESKASSLDEREASKILVQTLPVIRGEAGGVLCVDRDPEVLGFLGQPGARELSQVGAACPDHLVHTKRTPLFIDWSPTDTVSHLVDVLRSGVREFKDQYRKYFSDFSDGNQTMFSPGPRVILIPGVGMVTQGKDASAADVTRQLYRRAIAVMQNSRALGGFTSLSRDQSFAVEYWPLELYKLSLKPSPRPMDGRVALVTGGASGIGSAVARELAQEGAHVVIADLNEDGAENVACALTKEHGLLRGLAVKCDVTSEAEVKDAFAKAALAFGGVDIVINNAGIASSASIEDTSLDVWNNNQSVLVTGYFLVAREAFTLLKRQGIGGSLVFVVSKNAVAAGKNAAAYSSAKAAELHLARCLAEEGGAYAIRVNSVLPDAVISGSSIWNGQWRKERAETYGIEPEDVEEHYRSRTTLKVNVFPEDIAKAVVFLASDAASKTTAGVLTVDGGVPTAYVR